MREWAWPAALVLVAMIIGITVAEIYDNAHKAEVQKECIKSGGQIAYDFGKLLCKHK